MSFLKRFTNKDRAIQERLDTLKMFLFTSAYKNYHIKRKTNPTFGDKDLTMEEITDITDQPMSRVMTFHEHRNHVYDVVNTQIFKLYKNVASIGGINPYPNPIFKSSNTTIKDPKMLYLEKKMNILDIDVFNPGLEVEHPDGFRLQIRKSDIDHPESGYGVFIFGTAIPGTVVALYPGIIYNPTELTNAVTLDNEYMITRYDCSVIDGKNWEHKKEEIYRNQILLPYATGSRFHEKDILKYKNPFGIGNYINHPPPDKLPNLQQFSYNYPLEMPDEYHPYIPNFEYKPYFKKYNFLARGLILVTNRLVRDEEVFFNYRYNPANPYPAWYFQPDQEEAKRRWSPIHVI